MTTNKYSSFNSHLKKLTILQFDLWRQFKENKFLIFEDHTQTISSPSTELLIFLLKVFQFFHPFRLLLSQRVHTFPCVVDVGPALPFDKELSLTFLLLRVKISSGVSIGLYSIECGGSSSSCVYRETVFFIFF